jgi:hypothetical protein
MLFLLIIRQKFIIQIEKKTYIRFSFSNQVIKENKYNLLSYKNNKKIKALSLYFCTAALFIFRCNFLEF